MKKQLISKIKYFIAFIAISFVLIIIYTKIVNQWFIVNTNAFFFDTFITITLYCDDSSKKDEYDNLLIEATTLCTKYENIFSYTNENSELFKINNSSDTSIVLSKEMADILKSSTYYSKLTNNAFNPFLGKLWEMWDFNLATVPSLSDINTALKHIDSYSPSLKDSTLEFVNTENKPTINLGAIAKGYIADKLKEFLLDNGVEHALINLGGNILTIGSKPNNEFYRVAITKPFYENEAVAYVDVMDLSVVTSGIYERFFKENDVIYHHILNPSTGHPVNNNLYSVTIISESSTTADALSTSVFVMGFENGLKFINELENVYAIFIDKDYNIILSNGLTMNDNIITISSSRTK